MKQLPTWMTGVVMAVMFAVMWFALGFITTPELHLGPRALISAFTGALFGTGMGFWLGRQRRGFGQLARRPEFGKAVRRGAVPADADPAEWRRALQHLQKQYRPLRWLAPALYLPMTALSIWLAVTGEPMFWVGAGFMFTIFVITTVSTPRVLRKTTTMLAEVDRRDTAHLTR
ncbi:hypothetical protein QUG92_11135 [Curtobacterium sp. RHCKG23]|uniref:Uncharacterized protein n=2 Tax=Curtobacterium citri TaxID=3055139 RepID=A0ABT7T7W8_9MICO|nr:hypothetical protein [Curtobacterium citri]